MKRIVNPEFKLKGFNKMMFACSNYHASLHNCLPSLRRILVPIAYGYVTFLIFTLESNAFIHMNHPTAFYTIKQNYFRDQVRHLESTRENSLIQNASTVLKISLPQLPLLKNNTDDELGNNSTASKQDELEKKWFRRWSRPPLNVTNITEEERNKTESKSGILSRMLQFLPLFTKSSGESILDDEVQISKKFGNNTSDTSIRPNDSSKSTNIPWFSFNRNTAQDNIPNQVTENINATNPVLNMLFGIPSLLKFSMGSLTTSVRNSMDEEWIVVCQKTQVSPGAIVPVVAGGINLLIIASKDGKRVYCVANSCPHLGTPLETGLLEQRSTPSVTASSNVKRKSLSTGGMVSSPTVLNATDIEGRESCIVCPLHRTAFALESGEVRGEWCPYPPIIGSIVGLVKPISKLPTFAIRTRGKNIEVLINSRVDEMGENE